MSIIKREVETYTDIWAAPHYADHSPGEMYLPVFLSLAKERGHVLDAGTGSGKGALALQKAGFRVTLCDISDAGLIAEAMTLPFKNAVLWQSLKPLTPTGTFDYTYCTDVLEHLPKQFTMLAIHHLLSVSRVGLFLGVSLVQDTLGAWIGKPLHQTVESFQWWKESLAEIGHVTDARDLLDSACFFIQAKR